MNTSNAIINVLYMVKMMCIESILHNNRASRGSCWWSLAAEPIFGTPETLFYALRICKSCSVCCSFFAFADYHLPFILCLKPCLYTPGPIFATKQVQKKSSYNKKRTILTPHSGPLAIDRTFAGWHTSSVVADITNKDTHSLRHSTGPSCPQEEDPVLGI